MPIHCLPIGTSPNKGPSAFASTATTPPPLATAKLFWMADLQLSAMPPAIHANTLPSDRHEPKQGAFSICVHRNDAATVSYSEIVLDGGLATFRYAAGHPCQYTAFRSARAQTRGLQHLRPPQRRRHR